MIILANLLAMALVIISCQRYEGAARLQWLVTPVHLWTGLVSSWSPNSFHYLYYPFPSFPHSPGLLVGLWGARSFTILPPPPWLACRSIRSQVLYYPFPFFPYSPGLLVGLWGARSFTILPPSPDLLVGLWGVRSFTILSHPSPTPLACL